MKRSFYKSLDRQFEIFGLRGRWVNVFLYGAGGSLAFGVVVGFILGTGYGIATVVCLVVASFLVCLSMQSKTTGRQLPKKSLSAKMPGWVLRRESLSRILLDDSRFDEVKRLLSNREARS